MLLYLGEIIKVFLFLLEKHMNNQDKFTHLLIEWPNDIIDFNDASCNIH
jgi:hypothetical protein